MTAQGIARPLLQDLYHRLIAGSWGLLFGLFSAVYLGVNLAFAAGYTACGPDAVANLPGRGILHRFFFSVETISTIGYGVMAPNSACARWLVTVESLVGLVLVAVFTGLVFGKFSRPTSRIAFSDKILLGTWDGQSVLMLRLGNARSNELVSAEANLCAVVPEKTAEGHVINRLVDLQLQRRRSPLFQMTWLLIHPIDEQSPFFDRSPEALHEAGVRLFASVMAHDGSLGQTVYASRFYLPTSFVSGRRFVDVVERVGLQRFIVHFERFQDTVPVEDGDLAPDPSPSVTPDQ